MSSISTTCRDLETSTYEDVSQAELSIYDLNKLIEVLLFASCTSVTSEWEPEECIYFLQLARKFKVKLQELGKPVALTRIKLFLEPDALMEDEWLGEVVDEFGEYIETWLAEPGNDDEPNCSGHSK